MTTVVMYISWELSYGDVYIIVSWVVSIGVCFGLGSTHIGEATDFHPLIDNHLEKCWCTSFLPVSTNHCMDVAHPSCMCILFFLSMAAQKFSFLIEVENLWTRSMKVFSNASKLSTEFLLLIPSTNQWIGGAVQSNIAAIPCQAVQQRTRQLGWVHWWGSVCLQNGYISKSLPSSLLLSWCTAGMYTLLFQVM